MAKTTNTNYKSQSNSSQADLNTRIQQKAKQIWEQKGRVSGKDLENWLEAERLVKSGKS